MSNLLQLLQEVDPAISTSMAADLRSALVAINQQEQVDQASADWSLNSWWQWLEDEGYNRDTLLASLQRLCASRLSAAALADLVAACRAHGDDPHGLEWVQTLIGDLDAELIGLFHTLEGESLLEDLQLAQTAGGMSTAGKWATGLTIGIGIPVIALCAYRAKKRGQSPERFVSHSIDQTNAVVHQEVRLGDNMALNAVTDPEQTARVLDHFALERGLSGRAQIFEAVKDAADYGYNDTLAHAKSLAERHLREFAVADYETVVREDVVRSLESNPRSLEKVMYEDVGNYNYRDANQVRAFLTTDRGKAYIQDSVNYSKRMGWDRLTKDYVVLVNREVKAAKAAKEAASARGDNLIEAERQLVRVDLDRNAGGLVGEVNQAVDAEVQIEYGDIQAGIIEEERLGEQLGRDIEGAA